MWRLLMRIVKGKRNANQRSDEEREASIQEARQARQARARSEQAKADAEERWHEVTRVSDDFASAMEKALRSMR